MPDQLTNIADAARREIRRQEGRAAAQLAGAYAQVWERIQRDLRNVTAQIANARRRGIEVNESWLVQNVRLDALSRQIELAMAGFDIVVNARVRQMQAEALEIKKASAQATMRIVRPEFWFFPDSVMRELVGFLADGSPVNSIINLREIQTGSKIRDTLIKGVGLGWSPRRMEREARQTAGQVLSHVLRIHRTESLRAFREAGYLARNDRPDIYRGWVWLSAADSRTCPSCWAMHGTIHRNNARLDDHPNGRCTARDLIRGFPNPDIKTGEELFKKLSLEEQGQVLSPAKLEAYRAGEITLGDLVHRRRSRAFGTTRREASLGRALQAS